jgi:predicted AAA+ superfamily ATPase
LLKQFLKNFTGSILSTTGDDRIVREVLESQSVERIRAMFQPFDLVVIDEAQKINQVGQSLKIAIDHLPEVRFVATGSSSFELAHQIGEPLTGRKIQLTLYPVSTLELVRQFGPLAALQQLDDRLVFGSYPEIMQTGGLQNKINLLTELRDSYLYKDILELDGIRNSRKINDLLALVAYQVGKEVSLQELGTQLGMAKATVERYLDLLEKAFVVVNVRGFSRNLRKEITKTSRYYFLDNGVLNAVINNFNPLSMRGDKGALWENFLFMERLKFRAYTDLHASMYFWRTYDRQEIDLIEEHSGKLFGFEFKSAAGKKSKVPAAWEKAYPESEFHVISRENWIEFVS